MTEHPFSQKTTVPTLLYRLAILFFGLALTGVTSYGLLYTNAQNDLRYLQIEAYRYDRERDKELRDLVGQQINSRFDQQEKKLAEISGDLKTLLRHSKQP